MIDLPPCVVFEDEHLLVVNKPAGWNTHAPAPFAGEGIYDWLRAREARWAKLAIVHRLDKETSGLMVFTKTALANRSLTEQFAERRVRKEYVLLTRTWMGDAKRVVRSKLRRVGERYESGESGDEAETEFELIGKRGSEFLVAARPRTGRTHQIRVHAEENGFPIVGDAVYGGGWMAEGGAGGGGARGKAAQSARTPKPGGSSVDPVDLQYLRRTLRFWNAFPERLCLHARRLEFEHPPGKRVVTFEAKEDFEAPAWRVLRESLVGKETNAFRWIHLSDWAVEQVGEFLYSQGPEELGVEELELLKGISARGIYHKVTTSRVRGAQKEASPKLVLGEAPGGPFSVLENGVKFEMSFGEGYSTGLFLDQRDNRRRVLKGDWRGKEVLNTFAYTCGFSVCAALAGARATSLDLSKKYLEWGKRNFALNGIDAAGHDFIFGDVFDWVKRFAKKGRLFDLVLLDPPTFSQAKESGVFQAEKDYGKLVGLALKVLRAGGTLFASCNAATWEPEDFMAKVRGAIAQEGRRIASEKYFPQPPDFPISREAPAYLKTAWFRIE